MTDETEQQTPPEEPSEQQSGEQPGESQERSNPQQPGQQPAPETTGEDVTASVAPRQLDTQVKTLDIAGEIVNLDFRQRLLGLRAIPYDVIAEHPIYGKMLFKPGAFGEVDPAQIRLRMDHEDPPTGLGKSFSDKPDGAYLDFKVSKTSRGDDQLQLAKDGVSSGASVGFQDVIGESGPQLQKVNGEWVTVYGPGSAALSEVSTTWRPTFPTAGVTHILSRTDEKESQQMGNEQRQMSGDAPMTSDQAEKFLSAFGEWQEHMRRQVSAPAATPEVIKPKLWQWTMGALHLMRGGSLSDSQLRELALPDVITPDNPGLVPDVLVRDFDDLINADRPFINSLRQIAPPSTGMSLIVPAIQTRAATGTQSAQKKDITGATAPKVGTITFPYVEVFGGADIAIQLLNRGDSSFFDLLTQLLAEAYALDAEGKAVDALLNPAGTPSWTPTQQSPQDGGTIDPENLELGDAWVNSIQTYRRAPDTIWMDAAAVGRFIDAKSPLTNAPLYSNLAAAFTAGNGPGGVLSGLRPVYVPALDDADVDVIVGPSRAYVYAEDPARTLQVDVPSKAGRDIALVGGFFFGPRAPEAFTTYTLGS